MKVIKPSAAIKQPLLWRQAISQSKFGRLNWKNFYCYPLTKWLFSFRKHESSLFDYTIIGSNPILTHMLLIKLYEQSLNHNQKLNVGIYFTGNDYWSYHLLEQEATWKFLEEETNIKLGSNFQQFCENYSHIFEKIELTIINSDNNSISYYQKDEQYSRGYVVHLKPNEYQENSFEKAMPHVNLAENKIRLQYFEHYCNWLSLISKGRIKKLQYSDKMQKNQDSDDHTHLLLSQYVYLTSLPYWVNCKTEQKEIKNYEGITYTSTQFIHLFNNISYGTANKTANDFHSLEHQTLEDFIEVVKKPL
jgi:hypothetical protein